MDTKGKEWLVCARVIVTSGGEAPLLTLEDNQFGCPNFREVEGFRNSLVSFFLPLLISLSTVLEHWEFIPCLCEDFLQICLVGREVVLQSCLMLMERVLAWQLLQSK